MQTVAGFQFVFATMTVYDYFSIIHSALFCLLTDDGSRKLLQIDAKQLNVDQTRRCDDACEGTATGIS